MLPLVLLPATAAVIARNEIVPRDVPGRILFFDRKADTELAAQKRAGALRLYRLASAHARRYRVYKAEADRLRAYQRRLRPAVRAPLTAPLAFRPAVRRAPPMPSAAPLFQAGRPVEEAPRAMDPSTPAEAMEATAAAPGAEPGASGFPWVKAGLAVLGGIAIYKIATRKKGARPAGAVS